MYEELQQIYALLVSFLGEAKNGFDGRNMQLQFPCPRCVERDGDGEKRKYNLEVNLAKQMFNCWKCSSIDDEMHGSIIKLIKLYGNHQILSEYKRAIQSLRESDYYKLNCDKNDFNIDNKFIAKEDLKVPASFHLFQKDKAFPYKAFNYLKERGIGWNIIQDFNIGFTSYDANDKIGSNRIIIPSYDKFGELNYWTGRDFSGNNKRQKYYNPKVERKDLIFNEERLQFDADITLVEGPFDHLVVPNSVPLLGKSLTPEYTLYWRLINDTNANINIFLDGDAIETAKETYKLLNHGRLYNKIRYVPVGADYDPSLIYQLWGSKGIIEHLKNAARIDDIYL